MDRSTHNLEMLPLFLSQTCVKVRVRPLLFCCTNSNAHTDRLDVCAVLSLADQIVSPIKYIHHAANS